MACCSHSNPLKTIRPPRPPPIRLGYTRVILAIVSLYYMPFDPLIASILYLLSGLLDAFDGYAARALDQGKCVCVCVCVCVCEREREGERGRGDRREREKRPRRRPCVTTQRHIFPHTLQARCLAQYWTW